MTPAVRRLFTPAEANKTLPLVRRVVADVLRKGSELRPYLGRSISAEERERAERLHEELNELLAEFDAIGCYYKDWNFETGLVDFPAVIDGRPVLLCWRSDEPAVTHYHGIGDGFAGRRAIPVAPGGDALSS